MPPSKQWKRNLHAPHSFNPGMLSAPSHCRHRVHCRSYLLCPKGCSPKQSGSVCQHSCRSGSNSSSNHDDLPLFQTGPSALPCQNGTVSPVAGTETPAPWTTSLPWSSGSPDHQPQSDLATILLCNCRGTHHDRPLLDKDDPATLCMQHVDRTRESRPLEYTKSP
ncbi:uncharacterized protein EI97DRAFT_156441 [Westerdykella ornata]|uniref:Uncharacterized protein n=1 Tax=Westerdykella ornata TaxID=318751 RepID=A0A6A6JB24_WESOR|nr:uncharacterized protein EI97DRAFT_156441 [Westerdykella ornata]KAF2273404.1 hypothetical protein EI97DRAFT_156441 [Westerdykella ornata]